MGFETISLDVASHVALLTLNRPPMNSVTWNMVHEIEKAIEELQNDKDVRVLVITGSGEKAFCAGMDIGDAVAHPDVGDVGRGIWSKVDRFTKPTFAAINGHALGGGCELTLCCHFRFMTDNPKALIGCPELNLAIIPGWGGTQRMTRLLGRGKALNLILNSKRLSSQEALNIGLVDGIFPQDQIMPQVMEMARALAEKAPIAAQAAVNATTTFLHEGIEEGLKAEGDGAHRCVASKDAAEGFMAFMEKRKPVFKGE